MRRALVLLLVVASMSAACTRPAVTAELVLASGHLGDSPWRLVLQDADDGVCLEVVFDRSSSGVCPGDGGFFGINLVDDPRGNGSILVVGVEDESMVAGDVTFDLRPGTPVLILDVGPYGRIAVAAVEGHEKPLELHLRNATGDQRQSIELP